MGSHRQGDNEEEGSVLGLSNYSVALGGGCLHIQACVLGVCRAGSKLILRAQDGWHPPKFFGMGGSGSKSNDKSVAGIVDNSSKLSKDFAIIKLHGGTSALVAGVVAASVLFYVAYRLCTWKRAKMRVWGAWRGTTRGGWTRRRERARAGSREGFRRSSGLCSQLRGTLGLPMRSSARTASWRLGMAC